MRPLEAAWALLRRVPAPAAYRLVHSAPAWLAVAAGKASGRSAPRVPGGYRVAGLGVVLDNPAGIGAGFDKDGRLAWIAWSLGVGFHVVGSVLPRKHGGVEPKIVARLPGGATLNRLGLPSEGAVRVAERLSRLRPPGIALAVNIAALEPGGYRDAHQRVAGLADWVEVNISCPNTVEHGTFEDPAWAERVCASLPRSPPLLIKIPPDPGRVSGYVEAARRCGAGGLVVANTLRVRLPGGVQAGLGGAPLYALTLRLVKAAREHGWEGMVVVASGGVTSPGRAVRLLEEGADLVEVVSALLLWGPRRVREIAEATARWAARR